MAEYIVVNYEYESITGIILNMSSEIPLICNSLNTTQKQIFTNNFF